MLKDVCRTARHREKVLADAMREIASELRLIDTADLVAYIRTEQFGNIDHLVSSSTELFYKPGTISFGQTADVKLGWGEVPSVVLGMEFHHRHVDVYFRLVLEEIEAGVEIDFIAFERPELDPDENTERLIHAIADARWAPSRSKGRV